MWQYPDLPLALSSRVVAADFVEPYNRTKTELSDYARGGVALLDAKHGLNVKNWYCAVEGADVYISAAGVPSFKVETILGVPSWISFAFDQNMHYNLAYILPDSGAFLYWYDANQQRYVTTSLGSVRTPFVRMDDVRRHPSFWNDIILSYIKGNALCVRMQRDRFGVEYVLTTNAGGMITQCGMNRKLRFQWETI